MPVPLQLAALLIVGWLPGAALYRAPIMDREQREALDAGERVFWQVILSLATALIIVVALTSIGRYRFEYLIAAQVLIAAVPVVLWRSRLRFAAAPRPRLAVLVPLALVALCLIRFFPGAEYIIAGKDPGTYVNEGVQIAQRGAYVVRDPVVAAVPAPYRDLFYPRHARPDGQPRTDYYGSRFMGFFIKDPDAGTVVGQFPHLFPAALAVGYGIDGLTGVRRTTPVLAMLGVVAVFFAGRYLFGQTAAAAGAALLALNVIQVWFARYPNSEVMMQAFTFAAVLALARSHAGGDRFFAPVAGILVGLLLFLRFDAVLVIAAVAGGLTLGLFAGQRLRWETVAGWLAVSIPAAFYLAGPLEAYMYRPLDFIGNMPLWQHAALVLVAVTAGLLLAATSRRPAIRQTITNVAPIAIAMIVAIAAGYALLLRHPSGRLTDYDAYAFRTFANFYVTVPAVLAALIGYALFAKRAFWRSPVFFVLIAVFGFFTFYKLRIVPEHFWTARRFLAVILPGTMLLAAAAAVGGGGVGWRARVVRPLIGGVFLALLAVHYVRASAPVADHIEYAGLIPRIEALAAQFGDRDLVIVESRDAGGDTHVFGLPLAYIYARNVLVLDSARPDKATFAAFIAWAETRYDRVLFLGGGGTDLLSHSYGVRAIWSDQYQVPEYQSALNAFPRAVRQKEFQYGVYEFTPPVPRSDMWFDLDVGTKDDLHVVRFRAKEASEGRTFRWTGAASAVTVTTMPAGAREVTLVMGDGGRPPAAPPAMVQVFLHNQLLGRIEVDGDVRPYTLAVPPELAARAAAASEPVELRLVTTMWNPAKVLGSPDDRDLGVMLDRVTIK
ncbi:MAG: glycosyltransferase family 39 protein [Vicinamibacterales bacterium]